jgi:hypothetical protein
MFHIGLGGLVPLLAPGRGVRWPIAATARLLVTVSIKILKRSVLGKAEGPNFAPHMQLMTSDHRVEGSSHAGLQVVQHQRSIL